MVQADDSCATDCSLFRLTLQAILIMRFAHTYTSTFVLFSHIKNGVLQGRPKQARQKPNDTLQEFPAKPTCVACRWAGGSGSCGKLLSGSYDGSVRMLDPSTATFELLVTDEDAEFSAMDCLADATLG